MKFVIVTDPFDDRSGGSVVLNLLCHRLNQAGETALIWPGYRPRARLSAGLRHHVSWLYYYLRRRNKRVFGGGPFPMSLAGVDDLKDAVVVYPEIVDGNPLAARNVVRWLLHKPGFHNKAKIGADELIFFYQDAFYDPSLGPYAENRLTLTWWNEAYKRHNHGRRLGSCFLIRKAQESRIYHDASNSIPIDDLPHEEKAAVFNRTEYFYTYDPYTLYSRYAALCGCIPIIVPQPNMTREQWVPDEKERYGLAYGDADIGWAVATRDLLLQQIADEQEAEAVMLRSFVEKCRIAYPHLDNGGTA